MKQPGGTPLILPNKKTPPANGANGGRAPPGPLPRAYMPTPGSDKIAFCQTKEAPVALARSGRSLP